jgi:protoporphyrinogen IX oxidase
MIAYYAWLKTFHILSMVSWMAGLLYLPRLFVYHAGVAAGSEASETFKVMERRLYRAIMMPALIATYLSGFLLAFLPGVVEGGWFYAKLLAVAALTVAHFLLGAWRLAFAADRNRRSGVFYRVINEVPTLLMIAIVILVVVKPF